MKVVSFEEFYAEYENVTDIEERCELYKYMLGWFLDANGLSYVTEKTPLTIRNEYDKALKKRQELACSFTMEEWKLLFKMSHKQEKGFYAKKLRELGVTEDELELLANAWRKER